jgi:molybdate transport system substrate-binding protein
MAADPNAILSGISSMATRRLVEDLAAAYLRSSGTAVAFESVGGVDAARRVSQGERVDLVVLASKALVSLAKNGSVLTETQRPFAVSPAALAVRSGARRPLINSPESLIATLGGARSIGYSTGPSGDALLALLERAGVLADVGPRLLQSPPGVPVADLIREGRVELGLQQLSELAGHDGIDVLGVLPEGASIETIFSAAVCATSDRRASAESFIDFLSSSAAQDCIRNAFMAPIAAPHPHAGVGREASAAVSTAATSNGT